MIDGRVGNGRWILRGAEVAEKVLFVVVAGQTGGRGVTRTDAALLRVGVRDSLLGQSGRVLSSLLRNRRRATCIIINIINVIARY